MSDARRQMKDDPSSLSELRRGTHKSEDRCQNTEDRVPIADFRLRIDPILDFGYRICKWSAVSHRTGRTYPGPPPEVEGIYQTNYQTVGPVDSQASTQP